ncbi:MAG TPA: ATP-grasp domain-containing protein [Thermoplasmata archaeon]|nr:ATP-grasp domain-containing protein [Thermoplasmata archaeon]
MKKRKVLVFPGGTEIGLEIWKSLKGCKDIILYSAGSDVSNHASYVFKNHFIVPDVHNNNWLNILNEIVDKYKIDYIFPAHDDVIVALARNANKLNTDIISSPLPTCLICRSKTKTYNKFKNLLPIPKVFNKLSEIESFPVFVKPDKGQGTQGAYRVDNLDMLRGVLKSNSDLIVMEYLPGKEYTVDCFTDRRKGLLFCRGRERIRIKSGISMNSTPVDEKTNKIFRKYADIISQELELYGAWFFQLKLDTKGTFKLLEIAPRIGGTMATHRVLGINFPLLSIYEKDGVDIEIMTNNNDVEIDRALVNRYKHNIKYNRIYVDLDDTLILNNNINTQLIRFLYQAINKGCKIILITKTKNDVENILKKWRLNTLFDEIILLKEDDSKADFIDPEEAIFIDDSFSERKSVFERHKIPTFDCSMIELLIDERC